MTEEIKIQCHADDEPVFRQVSGRSVWLILGPEKVRCFIHGLNLTHYASGYLLASVNPTTGLELDEDLAQVMLQDKAEQFGADAILARMSTLPVLNEARVV